MLLKTNWIRSNIHTSLRVQRRSNPHQLPGMMKLHTFRHKTTETPFFWCYPPLFAVHGMETGTRIKAQEKCEQVLGSLFSSSGVWPTAKCAVPMRSRRPTANGRLLLVRSVVETQFLSECDTCMLSEHKMSRTTAGVNSNEKVLLRSVTQYNNRSFQMSIFLNCSNGPLRYAWYESSVFWKSKENGQSECLGREALFWLVFLFTRIQDWSRRFVENSSILLLSIFF